MTAKQPNILFLMADQMAVSSLPFYGHPLVKTPHLSRLADEGVVFDSAYCNSPLCAPSRFTLMSGQLPSRIGGYDNAADFPADIPTFAHYLRDAGYYTALSGKMHFCGPDQLHGFEERLTTDIYPADYGWFVNWEDFDTRPSYYHNMSSVTQAGPCVRSNQLDFDDEVSFRAQRFLYDYVRNGEQRPFCLTVSMTHPHDPYTIPQQYWDRYNHDDIDMPRVPFSQETADPHSRRLRYVYQLDEHTLTEAQIRNARHAYYGAISYVDDQIGAVLKVLKETGLDEDTIIVFSGDHGDMLGERGLWYKMSWFEGSARVPMIVHAPGRFAPKRVSESVSTMDLLPTFAELANYNTAPDYAASLDGRSLLPHLTGTGGHDEVIGEYLGEGAIAPLLMIRRGRYKFVHSAPDPDQLFDLEADPLELNNLALDPAHEERCQQFRDEVASRWNYEQLHGEVIASQRRRRLVSRALSTGKVTAWDHQPVFDASTQFMRNTIDLDDLERRARFPVVAEPSE
ncbi:choline-sulfatase [Oceanisphaera psychrotolerans]|uniref:Choline-sulfatase n=1 Tax=Oceanisphaera psychrotolerans TaxID=1414654 RepID=A0A1J4QDM4_9GAMM|nr:choline-sulfatase [Oceanisphaera psychrotolerans]OIN09157.1 choline-sulfatase [Oceanisphaera psychrotolerans]